MTKKWPLIGQKFIKKGMKLPNKASVPTFFFGPSANGKRIDVRPFIDVQYVLFDLFYVAGSLNNNLDNVDKKINNNLVDYEKLQFQVGINYM